MKTNEIRIIIDASCRDVFEFTLEPKNTPQWIDDVEEETISTQQIALGTIYSNSFGNMEVTDYERDKFFELTNKKTGVICSHSYRPINDTQTELTYFEYVQDGSELPGEMKHSYFEKLKELFTKK